MTQNVNNHQVWDLKHGVVAIGCVSLSFWLEISGRFSGVKTQRSLRVKVPTSRVGCNWTEPGGKAPYPGFLLVAELAKVQHYPETRASLGGSLHRAGSLAIRSGQHAHAPGNSSASCCCNGRARLMDTRHAFYAWTCGSLSSTLSHPLER